MPKGTPFFKKKLGKEREPTVIQSFRSMVEVRKHTAESWRKKGPTSDLWGSGGVPLTADITSCRLSYLQAVLGCKDVRSLTHPKWKQQDFQPNGMKDIQKLGTFSHFVFVSED